MAILGIIRFPLGRYNTDEEIDYILENPPLHPTAARYFSLLASREKGAG